MNSTTSATESVHNNHAESNMSSPNKNNERPTTPPTPRTALINLAEYAEDSVVSSCPLKHNSPDCSYNQPNITFNATPPVNNQGGTIIDINTVSSPTAMPTQPQPEMNAGTMDDDTNYDSEDNFTQGTKEAWSKRKKDKTSEAPCT